MVPKPARSSLFDALITNSPAASAEDEPPRSLVARRIHGIGNDISLFHAILPRCCGRRLEAPRRSGARCLSAGGERMSRAGQLLRSQ